MKNDMILDSLAEINKLIGSDDINQIKDLLQTHYNTPVGRNTVNLLKSFKVSERLLDSSTLNGLQKDFNALLYLHFLLHNKPPLNKLETIKSFQKELKAGNKDVAGLLKPHLYIGYYAYFGIVSWDDYVKSASLKSWNEVFTLQDALPYCKVSIKGILDFIRRSAINFPTDGGVYAIVTKVCEKIVSDNDLGNQVRKQLNEVLGDDTLIKFFPRFLNAAVNGSREIYETKFDELKNLINQSNCVTIMQGLELSCPIEAQYFNLYLPLLEVKFQDSYLNRADYINLSYSKQISHQPVHDFVLDVSKSISSVEEAFAIINHLSNFMSHISEKWYREVAFNIYTFSNAQIVHALGSLMYDLFEREPGFVYEIMNKRLEALGAQHFLKESFEHLITEDYNLFKKHLTLWFLSDRPKVHSGLRELCSIDVSTFTFCQDELAKLTSSDKLYIATKIAGYVYTKESLQSLILSLTLSIKSEEKALLDNVYTLYNHYIIYNYRSTIDDLKEETRKTDLPAHLKELFETLIRDYEHYFDQLRSIQDLKELKPDTKLNQNLHFYEQRRYDKLFAEKEDNGFLSMFKSVQIKSGKWAIRRENQNVHDVQPLGHFNSSIEFPMGERLNPILQEKSRRHYQKLKRDEIDIN